VPRKRMGDVIVMLPGITGSVLQKDGKDVWAPTPGAVVGALFSLGKNVKSLALKDDPPDVDDLKRPQELRIGSPVSSYGKKPEPCSVPWLEELVMQGTAQGKAGGEVTFEIEGQLAGQITNVGGDQNTFLGEGRTAGATFGRIIAVLGLIVSVAGLGFLVVGGIETARAMVPAPPDWADYKDYVATDRLTVGLILVAVGIIVGKIGRLFARR
jgi:hypothetical protein